MCCALQLQLFLFSHDDIDTYACAVTQTSTTKLTSWSVWLLLALFFLYLEVNKCFMLGSCVSFGNSISRYY